jgi:arylsulfatase A-like enzyme
MWLVVRRAVLLLFRWQRQLSQAPRSRKVAVDTKKGRHWRHVLTLITVGVLAGVGLVISQLGLDKAQASTRPNIVFILTDDQTAKDLAHMPIVKNKLTSKGTKFTSAFVTTALCCPSRASILRGQYAHNHLVTQGLEDPRGYEKFKELGHENSTVATWLKGGGYKTALIGKYLNGYGGGTTYVPPGWSNWQTWVSTKADGTKVWNVNGNLVGDTRRHDHYVSDKAVEFISRQAGSTSPFFMYLAPYAPHFGLAPAPKYDHTFDNLAMPKSPSFNEADVSDKPAFVRNSPTLSSSQVNTLEAHYRDRLEALLTVDDMVGRIVAKLAETGKLSNTYIVFTSDNGYHMGEHRLPEGKWTAYEEDIKVPLIVRGPNVPAGRTLNHMVLNTDFAPTFAALGGVQPAPFVDGRTIRPLLGSTTPPLSNWRSAFVEEGAPTPQRPAFSAVRTKSHMYAEYDNGERELYDLTSDPYELTSLDANPGYDGLEAGLGSRLAALRDCAADSCRAAEGP